MFNLHGKRFSPLQNSEGGRVASDAVFIFEQAGTAFKATYSGLGFTDGHLIGEMTSVNTATIVYHCRADGGALEVGEAVATFAKDTKGQLSISMTWQWLNGTKQSGVSEYGEI